MRTPGLSSIAAILLAAPLSIQCASASDYSDGVKLFQQKNYRNAAVKFEAAMHGGSLNATTAYYCALSQQLSNNHARARQLYQYVSTNFPNSSEAGLAAKALAGLGGTSGGGADAGGSTSYPTTQTMQSGPPAYLSSLPDEIRVPSIAKRPNATYLEVSINGRSLLFQLDTGAYSTVVGANHLDELGLTRPNNGNTIEIHGVGNRQNIKGWFQKVDLKVGPIYRRDFPITVEDHMDGDPLLGQDFLKDFDTIVDARTITFRKKTASVNRFATARGTIEIPFDIARDGHHLVVHAFVNKKPYDMIFDTGASDVVFGFGDFKRLNIPLPDRAADFLSHGVAGTTNTWKETVDLQLGSIKKEDFPVSLVESEKMGMPLLGQSFFGSYKFMVDQAKHVIRLTED